jgi:hypothetical protein
VTKEKSFITLTVGVELIKLFFSVADLSGANVIKLSTAVSYEFLE